MAGGGNSTSDGHDSCHHTILGIAHTLNSLKVAMCLAVLCGTAYLFESLTHHIDHALKNTPYLKMVQKLYQELMIVGGVTVGLFVVINDTSTQLSTEVVVTFEFLHATFTMTTVFFVLQSALLIRFSQRIKRRINYASSQDINVLIRSCKAHLPKWNFRNGRILPLSYHRELVQFRVIKIFFQREYSVPDSFDFSMYLCESLNSYLVKQLDVSPSSFLMIIVIAFLAAALDEWIGLGGADDDHGDDGSYGYGYNSSHDNNNYYYYGSSGGHHADDPSLTKSGISGFIVCAWMLLAVDAALFLVVRRCADLLTSQAGCRDYKSYLKFLQTYEREQQSKDRHLDEQRLSFHNLQERQMLIQNKQMRHGSIPQELAPVQFQISKSVTSSTTSALKDSDSESETETSPTESISLPPLVVTAMGNHSNSLMKVLGAGTPKARESLKTDKVEIKFHLDLDNIFPLHSPKLLQKLLDISTLCHCILLSLLVTNYAIVDVDYRSEWERCGYLALMVVPLLLAVPVRGLCVQTHSTVMAVVHISPDIMGKVLEHQAQSKKILHNLMKFFRGRMRAILQTDDLHQGHLAEIFFSLPLNEHKHLPRQKFREFLTQLNIHMTFEQFDLLFRALDPLNRGVLSFESLYRTVLPQGSKAQANRVASACTQKPRRTSRVSTFLGMQSSTFAQLPTFAPTLSRAGSSVRFGPRREEVDEWAAAEGVGSSESFAIPGRLSECDEREEQSIASGLTDMERIQRESYLSLSPKASLVSQPSDFSIADNEKEWALDDPTEGEEVASSSSAAFDCDRPTPPPPPPSVSPESPLPQIGGQRMVYMPLASHPSLDLELSELESHRPLASSAPQGVRGAAPSVPTETALAARAAVFHERHL